MSDSGKIRAFPLPREKEQEPVKQIQRRTSKQARMLQEQAQAEFEEKFAALNKEDFKEISTTPRRRAREAALLLSFQMDMGGESWDLAQNVLADLGLDLAGSEFAVQLAKNAISQQNKIDELINKYAREWTVDRFAAIDRNILRLAIAELIDDETGSANIIINEAIELAKKFGDGNSSSFVNGILDAVHSQESLTKNAGEKLE